MPLHPTLPIAELRHVAADCHGCDLWRRATQTVFGEGPPDATMALIGEQPGDREDRAGHPFVGPAGVILDRALAAAGIDRTRVFVTNVVKHFKWEPRGKRRLHSKPNQTEVAACRPWLDAELTAIRPRVLVCLGATAAQALVGREVRVLRDRGRPLPSPLAPYVIATIHPSSILRAPDDAARHREKAAFVADLVAAVALLREPEATERH
jgi:DNA polymerase